jgi:hypothetical protein
MPRSRDRRTAGFEAFRRAVEPVFVTESWQARMAHRARPVSVRREPLRLTIAPQPRDRVVVDS